jgi:hypothetical protein
VGEAMADAARSGGRDALARMHAATGAFLKAVAEHPAYAQTLLVEIIGAGPAAARRRDQIVQGFADQLDSENARAAERGLIARFRSPNDAFAIVGAITELVSRQVRLHDPENVLELGPVIERLIDGLLAPDGR